MTIWQSFWSFDIQEENLFNFLFLLRKADHEDVCAALRYDNIEEGRSNRQVFSWMAPNWLEGLGKQGTSGQGAWESLKKLQEVNGGTRSTETLDMKFFVVIALAGLMQLMFFISCTSIIFSEAKHSILFPCLLFFNSRSRCGLAKQQERRWWYYTS